MNYKMTHIKIFLTLNITHSIQCTVVYTLMSIYEIVHTGLVNVCCMAHYIGWTDLLKFN